MDSRNRFIAFIGEIRKSLGLLTLLLLAGTAIFYSLSAELFQIIQHHLKQTLVFYNVAGPFLAHVKIALSVNILFLVPVLASLFWRALAKPFKLSLSSRITFIVFTCFLFYSGAFFCYFVTLPYGIDFLLSFQSDQLKPVISVNRFITFVTVFVLSFGLIFELPIFMVFSGKTGLIKRKSFENGRRYALLIISIVAALLTPTPDVVNMALMGLPLYLLYEFGIIILKLLRL